MDIVIPLFDRFTALDAVGPYEVLSRLPGARVTFAAVERRPYTTETGMLTLSADAALADLAEPEVLVVPGGTGTDAALEDEALTARLVKDGTTWKHPETKQDITLPPREALENLFEALEDSLKKIISGYFKSFGTRVSKSLMRVL